MFLCDSGNFEHFQYLVFFCFTYGKVKPFPKNWGNVFQLKVQILKTYHFRTKLPYQKPMLISIYLIISCVRVCLCVCICVFISFHHKGFSWLDKAIDVMSEVRSTMVCCGNISVSSTFVSASKTIIERTFKLATARRSVN